MLISARSALMASSSPAAPFPPRKSIWRRTRFFDMPPADWISWWGNIESSARPALLPFTRAIRSLTGPARCAESFFAELNLGWINSLPADANLPKDSTVTLIDRQGKILIRYPESEKYVDQPLPPPPRPRTRFSQIPLPLPREWSFRGTGLDGVPRLYGISKLGGRFESKPALITVGLPLAAVYATARQALLRNLLFLSGAAGLALLAAWYGGNAFFLRQ